MSSVKRFTDRAIQVCLSSLGLTCAITALTDSCVADNKFDVLRAMASFLTMTLHVIGLVGWKDGTRNTISTLLHLLCSPINTELATNVELTAKSHSNRHHIRRPTWQARPATHLETIAFPCGYPMHQSPSIYDAVPTAERRSLDMPNILIMVALNSIFIFRSIARFLLISCTRVRRILSAYASYYFRSLRRFTLCVVHRARRYFSAVNIFAWTPKRTKILAEPTVAPTVDPTSTPTPSDVNSPVDSTNAESTSTTATPAAEPPSDPPSSRRLVRDRF
jgi:hypothetical protein